MFERIRFLTSDRYNRVGLSNGLASGGIVVRRLLGLPVDGRYSLDLVEQMNASFGGSARGTDYAKSGDVVQIRECRPKSKRKSWEVVSAAEAEAGRARETAS